MGNLKYTLGLDIGIASIGWALLDIENSKVVRLGVRAFEKAENPKDGSSLASARRAARGARKRIQRRSKRLREIRMLLVRYGLMPSVTAIETLFEQSFDSTPYDLRAAGLDRRLSQVEWTRVLLHIAKHRGYKSNRKNEGDDAGKADESKKVLSGIEANNALLHNQNYRSVGEMMARDEKFTAHKRNKQGDYSNTVSRDMLEKETTLLFAAQREHGNTFASENMQKEYISLFVHQLPFASGDQILKMVGFCTFEREEKRAPKMSWTAERFVLLGKILNQKIRTNKGERSFGDDEMRRVIGLAYKNVKLTYAQIRRELKLDEQDSFVGLRYKKNETVEQAEKRTFVELKGTHQLSKKMKTSAIEVSEKAPSYFDQVAFSLTSYKTDEDIATYLRQKTELSNEEIESVSELSFSKYASLSVKAMEKIIPYMEKGMRYDQACVEAGYIHYQKNTSGKPQQFLPLPDGEATRNPVVWRALNQVRKVVNALIREYGSPTYIHIETARDINRPFDERQKIQRDQEENRQDRERAKIELTNTYGLNNPKGGDVLKLRLYREQKGMCAYSQKLFDAERVVSDMKYAEIDHILPFSRSCDNSYTNKVLVLAEENQNKKNKTPYEYFGADEARWNRFESWVQANIHNIKKKQSLLRTEFTPEDASEMTERNLSDTRYITKYVALWMKESLLFADLDIVSPVLTVNGRVTSMLRGRWGLATLKDRDANDLHHALDAAVVAASSRGMIKRISDYSANKELYKIYNAGKEGKKEYFPMPWQGFRKELIVLLNADPIQAAVDEKLTEVANYTQEDIERLEPIFVSRMPNRKATGPAHQETIRGIRNGMTTIQTPLANLRLKDLDSMAGKERDKKLYLALKARLEVFDGNAKKAFAEPFYKPTNNGERGPLVRAIKLENVDRSGIGVRGGRAANGDMVRVDVYSKDGKFYLVPHYVEDVARGVIKDRAIVANTKSEDEWQKIDEGFRFEFSLFYNDLVKIRRKDEVLLGYYKGTHRGTSNITIALHDGSEEKEGIGVRTCGLFEKYQVDPLGRYTRVRHESPPKGKRPWAGELST